MKRFLEETCFHSNSIDLQSANTVAENTQTSEIIVKQVKKKIKKENKKTRNQAILQKSPVW